MEQEFIFNNELHSIKLENDNTQASANEGFQAIIAGKQYKFMVSRLTNNSFSLMFNDRNRTVHVAESEVELFVYLDGRIIRLKKVLDDQKKFTQDGLEFGEKDQIKTPMPGKVIKILVTEGDTVKAGQPLVIVESMKMENEIKSPTDGLVSSINFKPGDLVEPDQPIIKLQPTEEPSARN